MKNRVYFLLVFFIVLSAIQRVFLLSVKQDSFKNLTIKIENINSPHIIEDMKGFLSSNIKVLGYKNLYSQLKANFKTVQDLRLDFTGPESCVATVFGVAPKWLVNDKLVLGTKKRLYSSGDFPGYELGKLNVLNVADEFCSEKLDKRVYEFLQKVPSKITNRYTVNYKSRRKIVLEDKLSTKQNAIIVDEDSILNEKKLAYVDAIEENGKVFDLRFKDRVIKKSRSKKRIRGL